MGKQSGNPREAKPVSVNTASDGKSIWARRDSLSVLQRENEALRLNCAEAREAAAAAAAATKPHERERLLYLWLAEVTTILHAIAIGDAATIQSEDLTRLLNAAQAAAQEFDPCQA